LRKTDKFEAFLECGILAHGFLRVRCADCAREKLVAFSRSSTAGIEEIETC
jgi:ribosomal protein S27E